jgi:hypothetical protein
MMHSSVPRLVAICLAGFPLLILPGCVRRGERIVIEPDGTAHLTVEFEGDPDDVRSGDAMLEDPGLWEVKDQLEVKDDGDEELTRTAKITVPPGGEFPTHYAGHDAELADLALDMATWLEVEERPDGTYYHFKRVYHRRDWARIDYFRHKELEDGLKKLDEKEAAELTDADRQDIANALLRFEAYKTIKLAEAAAESVGPPLAQDDWLAVHRGICGVFEAIDPREVMALLVLEGDEADAQIAAAVQEVKENLEATIERILDERDRSGRLAVAFMDQYERERQRYAITEDLQDDVWEVVVELPGRVVGHNSFGADEPEHEKAIQWEFEGDMLNDQDVILMATSVVEKS